MTEEAVPEEDVAPPHGWSGLGLRVRGGPGSAEVLDLLRRTWETPDLPPGGAVLEVRVGPLPQTPADGATPSRVPVSDTAVTVRRAGNTLRVDGGMLLDLGGPEWRLTVADAAAAAGAGGLLALAEAQRAAGWLPLHAATVTRGGRAISVCGRSGSGKSTAALRLAAAGWTVLAEDQSWVHPASGRVTGLDRHLRAYADSVMRFAPGLLAASAGLDAHGKHLLPLQRPPGAAHLGGVLSFDLPPNPARAEVVRVLWESVGVPLTPRARAASMGAVSLLARGVPVVGTDRERVLTQVGELLP